MGSNHTLTNADIGKKVRVTGAFLHKDYIGDVGILANVSDRSVRLSSLEKHDGSTGDFLKKIFTFELAEETPPAVANAPQFKVGDRVTWWSTYDRRDVCAVVVAAPADTGMADADQFFWTLRDDEHRPYHHGRLVDLPARIAVNGMRLETPTKAPKSTLKKGDWVKMTGYPTHPDQGKEGVCLDDPHTTSYSDDPQILVDFTKGGGRNRVHCGVSKLELIPDRTNEQVKEKFYRHGYGTPTVVGNIVVTNKGENVVLQPKPAPSRYLAALMHDHNVSLPEYLIVDRRDANLNPYKLCLCCKAEVAVTTRLTCKWVEYPHGRNCDVAKAIGARMASR